MAPDPQKKREFRIFSSESVYLRYDIVSQRDLAIAREKLEAFHIEQKESTRKDNQSKSQPAN